MSVNLDRIYDAVYNTAHDHSVFRAVRALLAEAFQEGAEAEARRSYTGPLPEPLHNPYKDDDE